MDFLGSHKERRKLEDLADLYSVFKATEHLERAYIRDSITSDKYTTACQHLISQFKTTEKLLQQTSTDDFIQEYKLDSECPLAVERLIVAGVPATIMHSSDVSHQQRLASILIAEATQEFITAMDVLRLDQRAVDEIQPVLSALLSSLNKVDKLTKGFNKVKLKDWLVLLNSLRAENVLNDNQVRQLLLDLETSYSSFKTSLTT